MDPETSKSLDLIASICTMLTSKHHTRNSVRQGIAEIKELAAALDTPLDETICGKLFKLLDYDLDGSVYDYDVVEKDSIYRITVKYWDYVTVEGRYDSNEMTFKDITISRSSATKWSDYPTETVAGTLTIKEFAECALNNRS